jgi:hypothetical protein
MIVVAVIVMLFLISFVLIQASGCASTERCRTVCVPDKLCETICMSLDDWGDDDGK